MSQNLKQLNSQINTPETLNQNIEILLKEIYANKNLEKTNLFLASADTKLGDTNEKLDEIILLLTEINNTLNNQSQQFPERKLLSILIIAAAGVVIAYAINVFLHTVSKNHVQKSIVVHLIYVIGVIVIAISVAYLIDKWINTERYT